MVNLMIHVNYEMTAVHYQQRTHFCNFNNTLWKECGIKTSKPETSVLTSVTRRQAEFKNEKTQTRQGGSENSQKYKKDERPPDRKTAVTQYTAGN